MILYFGNILSSAGNNPSFIEILGPRLSTLTDVKIASNKRNAGVRLAHMAWVFISNLRKASFILIDTYSYAGFYYALMIGMMANWTGKKYIPIIRGGDFKRRFSITPRFTRYLLGNAFAIVAPSVYIQTLITGQGYKATYIPNFVNKEEYPFLERRKIGPRLLWVRSFHKIYNPSMALLVLKELTKVFPYPTLGMVGPDKDSSGTDCRKLAKTLGLEDLVVFTGKMSKAEWIRFSQSYDVFINTTTIDNHPVSVIEAMLLGLPVVSTNVGGLPDLVMDGREGLLIEPGNIQGFVEAIMKLLETPGLVREIQDHARKKAETFDWPEVKSKWMNLLSI